MNQVLSFSRKYVFFVLIAIGFYACESDNGAEIKEVIEEEILIVEENGIYTEWYPGKKQIKTSGRLDDNGNKTGIWKHFSPLGVELSITVYKAGKKDGHIVVRYPNGAVRYSGEYYNDEKVGEWKFYDENGKFIKKEDFGY